MEEKKVSIILSSYNYQDYIGDAIKSVIAQTYRHWELIIIDDGSTDNSLDVINNYVQKDKRIKLYQHENGVNKGLKDTILLGITKCSNEWIAFLESDDILLENSLEEKIKVIERYPNVGLVFSDVRMFGDKNKIEEYDSYFEKVYELLNKLNCPQSIAQYLININLIPTFSCVLVNKNELLKSNFNSSIKPNLDWFLWLQISLKKDFYYINKKLTLWRMHEKSYINEIEKLEYKNKIKFSFELTRFACKNSKNIGFKILCVYHQIKLFRKWFLRIRLFKPFCICFCGNWYSGYSTYWYKKILEENDFEIIEMQANGNFFEYLLQEINRLPSCHNKFVKNNDMDIPRDAISEVSEYIDFCSKNQKKSEDILCFGWHVLAKKK